MGSRERAQGHADTTELVKEDGVLMPEGWTPPGDQYEGLTSPEAVEADGEWKSVLLDMELHDSSDEVKADLQADWLLERIAEAQEANEATTDFVQRRLDMVAVHGLAEIEARGRKITRWATQLREVFRGMTLEGKKKSKTLPHGKVGTALKGGGIVILDQKKADAWAKDLELTMKRPEPFVQKTPIVEWMKARGEVPDPEECGWAPVPQVDEWYYTAT